MLVLLGELILASAEVNNQSERQGHIHATGKEGDFLRDGVLENLDIVVGEILDQCSAGIPRGKSDVHEPHVNPDRLLGPADADGEKQNKEGQSAHESSSCEHLDFRAPRSWPRLPQPGLIHRQKALRSWFATSPGPATVATN